MTPALVGADRVLIVGKRGTAYALDRHQLGQVGGQLAQATLCGAYGTAAVQGRSVYVPCSHALARVDMDPDGTLHPRWQAGFGATGSPVVGGGAVWAVDYATGVLRALDPATGRVLAQASTGPVPHFVSPVLTGSRVLVGTSTGVTAFDGG
ncbi:PQQ-binding-like beta-propeller repeat protein [Streptacidiphilus monticola]